MNGEEFLNKLYQDLHLSDEVQHTAKGKKNKNEAVKKYMDRLERIHNSALFNNHRIKLLKELYHIKYIIKKEELPRNLDKIEKERIIKSLEESLDKWLDYLLDENTKYPMWAKYWVFQGMLKIGTFNEETGTYQKRTEKTQSPFIEPDPELIAKCISTITNYIEKKEINDKDLEALIKSGSFQKMYTKLIKKKKETIINDSNKETGIWITYHYETEESADKKINPEYLKLYNSLQGHNTGWCTAGDKFTAKDQICGTFVYQGGDFHVYYTKDNEGNYTIPRIAIRMSIDRIGEIKGIAESQNLEEGLESIVEQKLKSIPNLNREDIDKNLKIINNLRKLTKLNKKTRNKEELTLEEITFIYEIDEIIKTFGWGKDERIDKIREKNPIKTKDIALKAVKKDGNNIKYIDKILREDKEIAEAAIEEEPEALEYIDSKIENYKEMAIKAVKIYGFAIKYVDKKIEGYEEIAKIAVKQKGCALEYIDSKTKDYEEIALLAVKENGHALEYVDSRTKNYEEIAIAAIKQNGVAIHYIDSTIKDYKEMAIIAIQKSYSAIEYVDNKIEGYDEIVLAAIQEGNATAIKYLDSKAKRYKEIAIFAVKRISSAIKYVDSKVEDYKEIALYAVKQNGSAIQFIDSKVEGYKELAIEAIKENPYAIHFIDSSIKDYEELKELANIEKQKTTKEKTFKLETLVEKLISSNKRKK